jgi:two-component system, LuxR family, sensor kinase FixL
VEGVHQAADVLGQALDHWRGDEALRESESVKAAILAAIPTGVAVLGRDGRIASVNAQWEAASRERGLVILAGATSGGFLDLCRAAGLAGLQIADAAREGVADVLEGQRPRFVLDYCAAPAALDRWFTLSAVPLPGADGGAVLTHAETTERRRAELSAQRSRDELAHVTRVSAMGELASSLAQRLHQPLSGIVRGAETARRMLAEPDPDLKALDSLLRRIVEDDRRARDVIEQLRELLRKSASTRLPVDVNAIVSEIVALVEPDAVARHVRVEVVLSPAPLMIAADRAQIAQVLLNLVLNGMEAMVGAVPADQRDLRIRTEGGYEAAVIMVGDSGPGVPGDVEALFEPFYTTKPARTGMGLPIARTIVEAHGGRVWGAQTPGRAGASFFVSLPLVD